MASTNVAVKITGQDRTGGVFASIAAKAKGIGRAAMSAGKAAAAAGIAAAAAVAVAANRLGMLSDVAQRAGTTTDEITQMSNAFGILGIKTSSVDEIARTMQLMLERTGRAGYDGFKQTVEEISKLPTAMERSTAATKVFGRTGRELMPIIEAAAKNGIGAIDGVCKAMPGIRQSAANAGDGVSDGFSIVWNSVKSGALNMIGDVMGSLDGSYGDARTGGAKAGAYIMYYMEIAGAYISELFARPGHVLKESLAFGLKALGLFMVKLGAWVIDCIEIVANLGSAIVDALSGNEVDTSKIFETTWTSDMKDEIDAAMKEAWDDVDIIPKEKMDAIQGRFDAKMKAIEELAKNYGNAAGKVGGGGFAQTAKIGQQDPKMLLAGSYAAATAGRRQQNRIQERMLGVVNEIKNGIDEIASNTSGSGLAVVE